jgi:hypothetical protein
VRQRIFARGWKMASGNGANAEIVVGDIQDTALRKRDLS